jgi:hypothetical protein
VTGSKSGSTRADRLLFGLFSITRALTSTLDLAMVIVPSA